jgi:hypothetical protein
MPTHVSIIYPINRNLLFISTNRKGKSVGLHPFFKIGAVGTTHLFDPNRKQQFFTDIYL